ncbi:MAG: NAD(P)-dependent alcohol dehydrogenase [Rubrobacter sp.]|nr:NAD(P)-dependent alcohol dehydrogenase [Rubrobacter sp.]
MKAWEIEGDFGIENLNFVDKDEPEPGFGEVLVGVRACSLNFRDYQVVLGQYDPKMPLPRIPFSDGAGEVLAVGGGVEKFAVGDRVAGAFMQNWVAGDVSPAAAASALGGAIDGMLAEKVVLAEHGLVRVPDHLSYEEAATLPCAAVTAWNGLVEKGGLKAGDTVLALGTGGVSVFALQIANMFGTKTIITSSSDEKLDRAKSMGASEGVNYSENPDWEKEVLELTGGRGVDHVVEVSGPDTLAKSLSAVRMGGNIAMIGVLTGAKGEIPTAAILRKSVRVQGIYVGSREMFENMNRAISLHEMRPVVDRTFPFEEAREALRHMEGASHFGKITVQIP